MKRRILPALLIMGTMISCNNIKTQNDAEENKKNVYGNHKQTEVLTLGTFHFSFGNHDVKKIEKEDQIDVLDPKYQEELALLAEKINAFKPTKIVVEAQPRWQVHYDSLYQAYLAGNHDLSRNEVQQVGFRLAKLAGLDKVHCVDCWGGNMTNVQAFLEENDSAAMQDFKDYFYHHPDTLLKSYRYEKEVFKTEGIIAELKRLNQEERIKRDLGNYLVGVFKYELPDDEQFGVDFTTGWWFNRNLRIFRNIQRLETTPDDRIFVIFGAGHMNLLNLFFDASPEYDLQNVHDYLQ
ncbi:MAG: DUF5694 domain-containing protein [Bacteroidales bacterium]